MMMERNSRMAVIITGHLAAKRVDPSGKRFSGGQTWRGDAGGQKAVGAWWRWTLSETSPATGWTGRRQQTCIMTNRFPSLDKASASKWWA